jgi:hypothetical protein
MATIQILREDQNRSVLLITGTGAESNTKIVNSALLKGANTVGGATGFLSSYTVQVESLNWSFNVDKPAILNWQGATGFIALNGTGEMMLKRDFFAPVNASSTIYNSSTYTVAGATGFVAGTGDVIMNYAGTNAWTILMTLVKNPSTYTQTHSLD